MNNSVLPPSGQLGKKGECDTITQGQMQDEEKQIDVERLEHEEEYSQQQKPREEHEIVIPPVFLGPDPEFLPENQPAKEPYYWETESNSGGSISPRPWTVKVAHNVAFYFSKALDMGECAGEMVANILGLTQSKYQYVIDAIEFDQWMKERQEQDEMDYVVSKTEGEAKDIVVECPGSVEKSEYCESTENC